MSDSSHIADLKRMISDPLHRRLLDAIGESLNNPEKTIPDYVTVLKTVLEEFLRN